MTYARSRLLLGVSTVGVVIVSALSLLISQSHVRLLAAPESSNGDEFLLLLAAVGSWSAALIPCDFFGGYMLPKRFNRTAVRLQGFALGWMRAVVIQSSLIAGCLWCILQAGQIAGLGAAVFVVLATQVFFLACQKELAALIAPLGMLSPAVEQNVLKKNQLVAADHADSGFTGSIVGLPGSEKVILPQSWLDHLSGEQLKAELVRRTGAIASGSRSRGILLAIAVNTLSFIASALLPTAGIDTVSQLVSTSLYFTLFSFLWLLLLPKWSREGVFEADRFAIDNGVPFKSLESTARSIEALHDEEPKRSRELESVFHPIPCVERRVAELSLRLRTIRGYWNVARLALFLSWSCGGFLSRAVHCNIGRPELWVLLPTD